MRPENPFLSRRRGASTYQRARAVLFILLAVLLVAPFAHAAERTGDVIMDGVIDLLAAELSDTVILQWLATTEDEPRTPSAQDLIALRGAGASDAIIVALLEKARGELEPPAAPPQKLPPAAPAVIGESATAGPSADSTAGPSADSTAGPSADSTAGPSADESRTRPRATPDDFSLGSRPFEAPSASDADSLVPAGRGAVRTQFTISNVPYWLEDEEPWSLFVYLNGEPLSFVAEGTLFSAKPLRFNQLLKPGRQRLMVFREKHDDDDNEHLTRVMPRVIEFDLAPGGFAEVELAFKQTVISLNDPVSFRVAQSGRLVAESEEVGGDPNQWQWLCDDLERTLDGKRDSRLEDCVRWRDLWQGYEGGPTRSQVLQAFSNFEYRPVPRDQSLF